MNLDLDGKHIAVAGASRGFGFAIVKALLEEGARVSAIARSKESLRAAEDEWRIDAPDGFLYPLALDLSDDSQVDNLRSFLGDKGPLSGLVTVAGNGTAIPHRSSKAFQLASNANVTPALVAAEAALPLLQKTSDSSLLITSSIAGVEHIPCPVEYAAAKSALRSYASHWARQWAPTRVNVLAPGNMLTSGSIWDKRLRDNPTLLAEELRGSVALGRLAAPSEVANVAVFLLSAAASFVSGTTVVVDGGQTRQW